MQQPHVIIREYRDTDESALIAFMGADGFADSSTDPRQSVIASVLAYQKNTNNLGLCKGLVLEDTAESKIVGYFGRLAMQMVKGNQPVTAVQSYGAFIKKGYPGFFSKMIIRFYELGDADIYLSVFPVHYIFNSYLKTGYTEICQDSFKKQYYLVTHAANFIAERIRPRKLPLPAILLAPVTALTARLYGGIKNKLTVKQLQQIPANLTAIKQFYRQRYAQHIVTDWNEALLAAKYNNKIADPNSTIRENEVIVFAAEDNHGQAQGLLILKKVRGMQSFTVSDLQTAGNDSPGIARQLMNAALQFCRRQNFNAIIFSGLDPLYEQTLTARAFIYKRVIDRRVYGYTNSTMPLSDVRLFFADDDMNY